MMPRPDGGEIFLLGDDRLLSVSVSAAIGALHGVVAAWCHPNRLRPPRCRQRAVARAGRAAPGTCNGRRAPKAHCKGHHPSAGRMPSAISAQFEPKYDPVSLQLALRRELGVDLGADGGDRPASRRAIADWQLRIGSNPTGFLSVSQWYRLKGPVE